MTIFIECGVHKIKTSLPSMRVARSNVGHICNICDILTLKISQCLSEILIQLHVLHFSLLNPAYICVLYIYTHIYGMLHSMWYSSSLNRDQTSAPCNGSTVLITGPQGESPLSAESGSLASMCYQWMQLQPPWE